MKPFLYLHSSSCLAPLKQGLCLLWLTTVSPEAETVSGTHSWLSAYLLNGMRQCCCCLFVLFFNCVINPLEYKHQEGRGCLLNCYIPPARKHRAWQKSALDQCLLKSMDNCLLEWMYENNSSASATVWCVWLRCHVPQGVHTLEALHTTAWQIWFFRNKKYIYILQVQSRSIIIMREK